MLNNNVVCGPDGSGGVSAYIACNESHVEIVRWAQECSDSNGNSVTPVSDNWYPLASLDTGCFASAAGPSGGQGLCVIQRMSNYLSNL